MDKCITTEEKDDNGAPLITQIMYNYEFIDDFDEPKLGRLDNFLLKVLCYKSESRDKDASTVVLNPESVNWNQSYLPTNHPPTIPVKQSTDIPVGNSWGPNDYEKDNHTMTLMVRIQISIMHREICVFIYLCLYI